MTKKQLYKLVSESGKKVRVEIDDKTEKLIVNFSEVLWYAYNLGLKEARKKQ